MLPVSKSDIFVSKNVKYSSEVGEENKKFLKLNFTGPEFFSLRQTQRGAWVEFTCKLPRTPIGLLNPI
jgi:hypothetical protein